MLYCLRSTRHVGAFCNKSAAVRQQCFCIIAANLILRRTGERTIAFNAPWSFALKILDAVFVGVFLDTPAFNVLQVHYEGEFLSVNAVRIVDCPAGVGKADDLCTKLIEFFNHVLCNISGAGDGTNLTLEILAACFQHFFGKIHTAVPCGFRPYQRTAPVQGLAG